jgi:hypothetical protein
MRVSNNAGQSEPSEKKLKNLLTNPQRCDTMVSQRKRKPLPRVTQRKFEKSKKSA